MYRMSFQNVLGSDGKIQAAYLPVSGGGGGVSSLNSLTGAVSLTATGDVSVSQLGNTITRAGYGVSSLNTFTGPLSIAGTGTVSVSQMGSTITVNGSAAGNVFNYNTYGGGSFTITGPGDNKLVATVPTVVGGVYAIWGGLSASAEGGPNFSAQFSCYVQTKVGDPLYYLYIGNKGPFTTGGPLEGVTFTCSGVFQATDTTATINFIMNSGADPLDTVTISNSPMGFAVCRLL